MFYLLSQTLSLALAVASGFPDSSDGKESACNVIDLGLSSGLGKIP